VTICHRLVRVGKTHTQLHPNVHRHLASAAKNPRPLARYHALPVCNRCAEEISKPSRRTTWAASESHFFLDSRRNRFKNLLELRPDRPNGSTCQPFSSTMPDRRHLPKIGRKASSFHGFASGRSGNRLRRDLSSTVGIPARGVARSRKRLARHTVSEPKDLSVVRPIRLRLSSVKLEVVAIGQALM